MIYDRVVMAFACQAELLTAIEHDGWTVTGRVVAASSIEAITADFNRLAHREPDSPRRGGIRDVLGWPSVRDLARSQPVGSVAELVLGRACFAVRAVLFDKTPSSNWKVIWHQDLTIAVKERVDTPGFGPWTNKAGIPHVQAPVGLLERMVAIRVHLDPCGPENGPMRVLPGSHREGRLSADAIAQWRSECAPVGPSVERGGMLAFRPLLLHASSPALVPSHRRVVHIEFAADELPAPLQWNTQV
jgi:ectoine hydroxylase-related dioxygenase (phytanoyl-CoA dioxygenase family)